MVEKFALLVALLLVARSVGLLVWAVRQAVAGAVPQTRL